MICSQIIETQIRAHQSWDKILEVTEDVVVGIILMTTRYRDSTFYGTDPKAIMNLMMERALTRIKDTPPLDVGKIIDPAEKVKP